MGHTKDTTSNASDGCFEELAIRESDGIRVSLLWARASDNLKVVVAGLGAETDFELEVGSAPPLDVFNHPYAYQAYQATTFDPEPRSLEVAQLTPPEMW